MGIDWRHEMESVADDVRHRLSDDLSLTALAARSNVSPFHFHRLFSAVCGETPAAFVRRVRVERAGKLIRMAPERSLTAIALEVGLSSPGQLSRAFRAVNDMAPSEYRSRGVDPLADGEFEPEVTIRRLPAMRLACVRARGVIGLHDLTGAYATLSTLARTLGLGEDWQLVGMSWDSGDLTDLDLVTYDFGAVLPDAVAAPPGVRVVEVPETDVVAVACDGPMERVADAWDHLYGSWFLGAGRRPRNLPSMKWFRRRPDEVGWSEWHLDCMIALEDEI